MGVFVVAHPERHTVDAHCVGLVVGVCGSIAVNTLLVHTPESAVAVGSAAHQLFYREGLFRCVAALGIKGVVVFGSEEVCQITCCGFLHVGRCGFHERGAGESRLVGAAVGDGHLCQSLVLLHKYGGIVDGEDFAVSHVGDSGGLVAAEPFRSLVGWAVIHLLVGEKHHAPLAHFAHRRNAAAEHACFGDLHLRIVDDHEAKTCGHENLVATESHIVNHARLRHHSVFDVGYVGHLAVVCHDVDVGVVVSHHKVLLVVVVVNAADERARKLVLVAQHGLRLGALVEAVEAVVHKAVNLVFCVNHILSGRYGEASVRHPFTRRQLCACCQWQCR